MTASLRFYCILFISLFFYTIHPQILSGQDFEGTITFEKLAASDTFYFSYHVKNNTVRIDEYDQYNKLLRYYIIDIKEKTVKAVHPEKKLYRNLHIENEATEPQDEFEIIKTQNYKEISGVRCYQWRVRNSKQNTEVAYWVADKPFNFFAEVLKILNHSERTSSFFLHIPNTENAFPMQIVERSLLRIKRASMQVLEIQNKPLDDSLFTIPLGFQSVDI